MHYTIIDTREKIGWRLWNEGGYNTKYEGIKNKSKFERHEPRGMWKGAKYRVMRKETNDGMSSECKHCAVYTLQKFREKLSLQFTHKHMCILYIRSAAVQSARVILLWLDQQHYGKTCECVILPYGRTDL